MEGERGGPALHFGEADNFEADLEAMLEEEALGEAEAGSRVRHASSCFDGCRACDAFPPGRCRGSRVETCGGKL